MITNPKTFFEQFQNFIEESGLQLKNFKSNLSNYFTKSEAIDTFLGKTDQAESAKKADEATKATQDSEGNVISSTYLKTNTASTTYLTQANASSTYLTKTGKAVSATIADTAGSATKATQDAKGNVIDNTYLTKSSAVSTYLTKDGKAESAKSADSATKAIQDGDGNVISGTYLKSTTAQSTYLSKTDASSTYLGKTAKAASATTADSATKATQDASGNVITSTYATKTEVNEVSTTASIADTKAGQRILMEGSRGTLAGYSTPVSISTAVTINGSSNDDTIVTAAVAVTISNGSSGQTWIKTVALQNASATVTLGSSWKWVGGSAPTIMPNSILVVKWCGTFGLANLVVG